MNRIIFNSNTLVKFIYGIITPLIPEEDEYEIEIKCWNGELSFGDSYKNISVTSRQDFIVKIGIGHLRKLFRVLTKVPEQPLICTFEDNGFIQVDGIQL